MKQRILRLRAVFISVVIGVGFLTAVLAMSDSLWHTTEQGFAESLDGYSYVLDPEKPAQAEPLDQVVGKVESISGVEEATPAIDSVGFVSRGSLTDAIRLRSMEWLPENPTIEAGSMPSGAGEVLLDASAAADWDLSPGDPVRVKSSPVGDEFETATVAGLVATPENSPLPGANMVIYGSTDTLNTLRGQPANNYTQILVTATPSADTEQQLQAATSMPVNSIDTFVSAQAQSAIPGAEYLQMGVTAVAVAAFFVLALVIRSVFGVRVEQDRREYALMRCLGASTGQVFRSVLAGALGVGLVGSVAGIALATGLLAAVLALPTVGMSFSVSPVSMVIAMIAGVAICLVGAFGPARQAMKSAPLEALMTADAQERGRVKVPVVRIIAVAVLGGGLWFSASIGFIIGAIACSLALFVLALTLIGPITQGVIRLIRAMMGNRGAVSVTEAVDSIRARPRRASSISSLVAITVAFIALVGAGSSTVLASMDRVYTDVPLPDMAIDLDENATSADHIREVVDGLDHVETSVIVNTSTVKLENEYGDAIEGATAIELDPDLSTVVHQPDYLNAAAPDTVFLGKQFGFLDGDALTATNADGRSTPVTAAVREEGTDYAFFTPEDFAQAFPDTHPEVWVSFAPGADLEAAVSELTAALAGEPITYKAQSTAERIVQVSNYLELITLFAVALLGIGVLIALIGVSNTLRVTVIERRQEIGLQRALGLLRNQVRAALTSESVMLTIVGGIVGLILGTAVAVAGVYSLATSIEGLRFALDLPVPFFTVTLLLAIVVAVAAALGASRKAVRVSPVAAIVS
ncbi:FtsX-like permease family protein [Arthrobacter sp.]|uniref:FtsX-like permease family protein n=1 Tax=Arthrobacter sp. TaxID=1667 RepID=UPI003A904073